MGSPGTTVIFCSACGAHNQPGASFCQSCGQALTPATPVPITASIAEYAAHPYGGFWIRVVAWFIDTCIVGLIIPVMFTLGIGFHAFGAGSGIITWWLYEALLTCSEWQATVGKKVLGMRITDLQGQRITFGRASGRHFAKYLSAAILGIGYLMVGFTERKQGLHDLLAGTLVMKKQ